MKLLSLSLENLKKFEKTRWDFADEVSGLPRDVILIRGSNGSGKTTVLQAIAHVLGLATGRLTKEKPLDWPGFDLGLANTAWRQPLRIEVGLHFGQDELDATRECWELLRQRQPQLQPPGQEHSITLVFENGKILAKEGAEALFQCKGRSYARQVFKDHPSGQQLFERVGYPFWYTDQRTSASLTPENGDLHFDEGKLRDVLSNMALFHDQLTSGKRDLLPGHRDRYPLLQDFYQRVFPGRSLSGPAFSDAIDQTLDALFYLSDGRKEYEISEMSGAERAIFPILFDFVNWNLNRSIILIDELELHLHPPIQQRLLNALPGLGKSNQFIITSHSDFVSSLVPDSAIVNLDAVSPAPAGIGS